MSYKNEAKRLEQPRYGNRGYFDSYYSNRRDSKRSDEQDEQTLCNLITEIVMAWNPEDPIDSMLQAAAKIANCSYDDLKAKVEATNDGPFSGDSLWLFFHHTTDKENRSYERFCLTKFCNKTDSSVDQLFADRDLSRDLLERLNKKVQELTGSKWRDVYCCSPRRDDKGTLRFWVNTSKSDWLLGWHEQQELEDFIKNAVKMPEKAA